MRHHQTETSLTVVNPHKEPAPENKTYELYQVKENMPNLGRAQAAYWTNPRIRSEVFKKVGTIHTDKAEDAYMFTQNVHDHCWGGPTDPHVVSGKVVKIIAGPVRSTMEGDVIVCGSTALMVNFIGWVDVSDPVIQ
jgi:hypothetical protein